MKGFGVVSACLLISEAFILVIAVVLDHHAKVYQPAKTAAGCTGTWKRRIGQYEWCTGSAGRPFQSVEVLAKNGDRRAERGRTFLRLLRENDKCRKHNWKRSFCFATLHKGEGKTGRSAEIKSRRAKEKGHCHVKKFSNALIDFLCGYYWEWHGN